MKKLPKTVYGWWAGNKGEQYFDATERPRAAVDQEESKRVGIYQFVGYATITNVTMVKDDKKKL